MDNFFYLPPAAQMWFFFGGFWDLLWMVLVTGVWGSLERCLFLGVGGVDKVVDNVGVSFLCMQVDVTSLLVQRSNQESTQARGRHSLRDC